MTLELACSDCHALVAAAEASEHQLHCPAVGGTTPVPVPEDVPAEIARLRSEAARLTALAAELFQTAAGLEAGLNPFPSPLIAGASDLGQAMRHAARTLCRSVERHNVNLVGATYSIRKVIKDDYHVIKVVAANGSQGEYHWNDPENTWEEVVSEPAAPIAAAPTTGSNWRGLKHRLQTALAPTTKP